MFSMYLITYSQQSIRAISTATDTDALIDTYLILKTKIHSQDS